MYSGYYSFLQYSLSPDPRNWGADLTRDCVESDDELHDPAINSKESTEEILLSRRGFVNVGCIFFLCSALIILL